MRQRLGEVAEEVTKRLAQAGITKTLARRALDLAAGQGRFTVFSVVEALTRLAAEL